MLTGRTAVPTTTKKIGFKAPLSADLVRTGDASAAHLQEQTPLLGIPVRTTSTRNRSLKTDFVSVWAF